MTNPRESNFSTGRKLFVILRVFVSSWWIGPGLYREDAKNCQVFGCPSFLRVELVGLGGHDEIVAMQSPDLVGPPRDRDASPFGQNGRVMSFPLGELPHSYGKSQSLRKILEAKPPFQPRDSVALCELPLRDPGPQLRDLRVGHLRGIGPARHAFLLCQLRHISSCKHHA